MIKRAPRPNHGFLILRNDVARDKRLSYLARGLLAAILSRPDNWTVSAERLAAETDANEGIKSIRRALRELETVGYLVRRRVKDATTGRFSWEQTIYDTARNGCPSLSISPKPSDGNPPDGEGPSKEEPRRRTEEEDEQSRVGSGRSAPYDDGDDEPVDAETITGWRAEDRDLFAAHVGAVLTSDGSAYTAGKFTTAQFYNLFRKGQRQIRWPGRYLNSLNDADPTYGVEDWLLNLGLSRVEA